MKNAPNLFIVGAPKAGTSSMHNYLVQHPDVFMTELKEPHFLSTDLKWQISGWNVSDEGDYEQLFAGAADERYRGESSTWYLCSRDAPQAIRDLSPEAKIIVMLREPVAAICSMFHQNVSNGTEDIYDLREAIEAEPDRRSGRRIPPQAPHTADFRYTDMVQYAEQLRRYIDVFSRDQIHVILFDDLARDTLGEFSRLLEFLDLEQVEGISFETTNAARLQRNHGLRKWLLGKPLLSSWIDRTMSPRMRGRIGQVIGMLNPGKSPVTQIDDDVRRDLSSRLEASVRDLAELLECDLSHWCSAYCQTS